MRCRLHRLGVDAGRNEHAVPRRGSNQGFRNGTELVRDEEGGRECGCGEKERKQGSGARQDRANGSGDEVRYLSARTADTTVPKHFEHGESLADSAGVLDLHAPQGVAISRPWRPRSERRTHRTRWTRPTTLLRLSYGSAIGSRSVQSVISTPAAGSAWAQMPEDTGFVSRRMSQPVASGSNASTFRKK